jgi:hypothetical protein
MGRETQGNSVFPQIKQLHDQDHIRNQFMSFLEIIDQEELKLYGKRNRQEYEEVIFPTEDLNYFGTITWDEICQYKQADLEDLALNLTHVISRVTIQENRIAKVLYWIEGKLSQAISMIPQDLLAYNDTRTKYQLMANHYQAVRYILKEKEDYDRLKLNWKNVTKNLEKIERMLWHRLNQITTYKER